MWVYLDMWAYAQQNNATYTPLDMGIFRGWFSGFIAAK